MRITNTIVKRILDNAEITYRGCHSPDRNSPLYGRAAYYMIDHTKVTFPVDTLEPTEDQLLEGLYAELKQRLESIELTIDTSWNGCMSLITVDPYSVKCLLDKYVEGQYIDLPTIKRT